MKSPDGYPGMQAASSQVAYPALAPKVPSGTRRKWCPMRVPDNGIILIGLPMSCHSGTRVPGYPGSGSTGLPGNKDREHGTTFSDPGDLYQDRLATEIAAEASGADLYQAGLLGRVVLQEVGATCPKVVPAEAGGTTTDYLFVLLGPSGESKRPCAQIQDRR
eukprot:443570-Rhodomonas_salina.2